MGIPRCAFGRPSPVDPTWDGPDHCAGCHRAVERACRQFERDVFFGKFNWRGYTPAEWKAAGHDPATWSDAR